MYFFFSNKNLGCYGDGGAIFTNNYKIHKACRQIRLNGKNDNGNFVRSGSRKNGYFGGIYTYSKTLKELKLRKILPQNI